MRRLLLAFVGALTLVGATPSNAQQQAETVGIRIVDVPTGRTDDPRARQYIIDHLPPGATITRRVEVANDTAERQVVQLYAAAATVDGGEFKFGDGRAKSDLASWTTVSPATVNPAAGAKVLADVTIAVPEDASPGERYGVVWAELAPAVPAGGGVTAVNRVGVRIYLSIGPGGEPASDFTITAIEAQRAKNGDPVVAATVRNTGGRALDMSGELRLTDGPGGLSAGPFPAKLSTTLGLGETEPVAITLDRAIPAGPWKARMVLRSGTTERDAEATITFPEKPDSAAGPVEVEDDSGGSSLLPVALGGAGLFVAIAAGLFFRSRMRRKPDEPV